MAMGALGGAACTPPPASQTPHLLLVSIDTLRADHISPAGYRRDTTPGLDRLAAQSVVYTHARTHAPWTKAAMASLFTSQLPIDHGLTRWPLTVAPEIPQLPEILHEAGFRTWAVTSHNAFDPDFNEFHHGFEVFDVSVWEGRCPETIQTAHRVTDLALQAWNTLDDGSEDPIFLWVHYFDPHDTYFHHDEVVDFGTGWANAYDEEIAWTDRELSRLLAAVEGRRDVVVAVVGDHGEELGERGYWGHAITLFEEQLRVPLLLKAPGLQPRVESAAVSLMDVPPTLLQLLDVEPPPTFHGRSLLPHPVPREHYAETDLRRFGRAVVSGDHKLIRTEEGQQLYDLATDPLERDDLAAAHPERVAALEQLLSRVYSTR